MGSLTVTTDSMPAALIGSKFVPCTGDAAGVLGGVCSGTIMMEGAFVIGALKTMFEGKPVCRMGDPLTMNHANTICSGWMQAPLPPPPPDKAKNKDKLQSVRIQIAKGYTEEGVAAGKYDTSLNEGDHSIFGDGIPAGPTPW